MSTEIDKLSDSLIESIIKNEKGLNLITDIADLSIKNIVEGPLNELPFVKYITGITKFGISIRDTFLIKKLLAFLREDEKIKNEKKDFAKKVESDKKYRKRVGDHLVLILDRYDHITKAEYLAKIFNAYLDEKITYEEFLRLSYSIEKAFISDLNNLNVYYSKNLEGVEDYILQNLYQSGLVSFRFNRITSFVVDQYDTQSVDYVRNELGLLLCKIISDYPMETRIIVPYLDDSSNRIFEFICIQEDINAEYNDYDKIISELKRNFNLDDDGLSFIFTNFKRMNLFEKSQENIRGHFLTFTTSFAGYDFYFNKLPDRNKFIKEIISALIGNSLNESHSFSREKNISQRRIDHCLMIMQNKGLISIQEHTTGILVREINESELTKFASYL